MLLQNVNAFIDNGEDLQQQQQQQQHGNGVEGKANGQHLHQVQEEKLHFLDSAPAPGWTVHVTKEGRLYYCNHITRTAGWLPPADIWRSGQDALPYGWERAVDDTGKSYYINHVNKTTTYETPVCKIAENLPKPKPRTVTLERSTNLGFGFVAGSEKPVIVRFVTEGGPSADKLLPGDQILSVNGEDVKLAPREHVISLVRSCTRSVTLEVCQPAEQQGVRKSTLLSATKKARLKCKPSRVRFAESVCVNGAPLFPPSAFSLGDICVPQMANVLKVFLENGQTKSFKYDTWTTVQDVVDSLRSKLCIQAGEHFSLVVEHIKSLKRNKLTLLDPQDSIARIASQPGAHKLRCLFRVTFVPTTAASLAQRDLHALDYLYNQCCNDVIQERFSPELPYDTALRLAALHMYQHALANNMQANKLTVKVVEKEFGLERFIPASVLDNLKRKEVKKLLGHFLKLHSNMTGSGKQLTQLQVKLHYLDITSQLPSYGAKCFSAAGSLDSEGVIEKVILVSPKFGISQIMGHRNSIFQPVPLANLEDMRKIEVRNDEQDEITRIVLVALDSDKILEITLEEKDALELVLVLKGYYKLLTGKELPVDQEKPTEVDDMAPSYLAQHKVIPEKWSYVDQGSLKSASFAVPPGYKNVNKKTNGLYNTIGRHCSKKSFNRYDLDGNMNKNNPYIDSIFANFVDTMIEQSVDDIMEKPANRLTLASEWQETSVDFDSDAELEEAGTLKHSDSLILLNKIHKEDRKMTNGTKDLLRQLQSESDNDNDSLYNPQDSPKCPSKIDKMEDRASGNSPSFGLRSPNTLDNQNNDQEFQEYLRRICEMKNNGSTDSMDMFVFDPDIIDLTFIPPPITPDELDAQALPVAIDAPPRPFADSTEHLDTLDLNENQDLEDFLAKVSVPPPIQKVTPAMELTPEEIMAYIIPPPPEKLNLDSPEEEKTTQNANDQGLTRNKSTLHDILLPKKPEKEEGPIIRPLPRRSFQELPPERPPKEFLKTPPKEVLEADSTDDTPMPQLPPRNPPGSGQKPQLPPKKLPLIAPYSQTNNYTGESRELRDVSTAVGTPVTTIISGKMAAVSIIDDPKSDIDQKHAKKKSESEQKLEELLSSTEQALIELLSRLKRASVKCLGRIQNGDEKESERTKEELTYQSLQLVTASKLLVIAMSEPTLPALLEHLATCLTILRRLTELCQTMETTAAVAPPLQTRNLILNVHELVEAFRAFVGSEIDRSSAKTVEEHLAAHAETLANILSTLLRRLKAFPSS